MSWVYLLYEKQHCKGNLRGNWSRWNMRRTVFGMVLASNLLGILAPVILKHMSSEIQLKQGRIRGWLTDFPGKGKRKMAPADAFFGLSYASLRNGDLRFQGPVASVETWQGTKLLQKSSKSACSQLQLNLSNSEEVSNSFPQGRPEHISNIQKFTAHTSEDCLSLTLYKPSRRGKNLIMLEIVERSWLPTMQGLLAALYM